MKAISLWQPWASLLVAGIKTIETRHWSTNYRGPLLIHAAKKFDLKAYRWLACDESFAAAVSMLGDTSALTVDLSADLYKSLPFGALIGQVELVDCKKTEAFSPARDFPIARHPVTQTAIWWEKDLGDFSYGRYGWVTKEPVKFAEPIPYKGQQNFFEVPDQYIVWKGPEK